MLAQQIHSETMQEPLIKRSQPLCTAVSACRLCGSKNIEQVLDLGEQALTGIFPKQSSVDIPRGPVALLQCQDCFLVQLEHSYDLSMLYGDTYGYRSGLNQSMVRHLRGKVESICAMQKLAAGDWVLDIGSNDGTLLGCYQIEGLRRLGIDPSAGKFRHYYQTGIEVAETFFTAATARRIMGLERAKVVTSISMFYDLESPLAFAQDVYDILDANGLWVFEQSYLPAMLRTRSYDTICQEHLEYYALRQIKFIADKIGFKIVDVSFNDVNGGSFSITAAKKSSAWPEATDKINSILAEEAALGLNSMQPFIAFRKVMDEQKQELLALLRKLKAEGKKVFGYGASTKGNVLLQYCGITTDLLPCIAEVNADKFGAYTPGTKIPIVSEAEAHAQKPDYYVVLPWHFRANIVEREAKYLASGGKLIFPLPQLDIVSASQ